jgi:protoporphyrinogen oxidase
MNSTSNDELSTICIGAGPACLTAAYTLTKAGVKVTVLERDPVYVGGISRTVNYKGFLFDIGGHRFFSKSERIDKLWDELLGAEFLERPRKSRIYYRRKLFDYPLRASNALKQLGVIEAVRCVLSYGKARLFPIRNPGNFEEWVVNQFGRRLFSIFFRTYTEKVWGMKCTEISADWAAQRIKGLSLGKAIWHALRAPPGAQSKSNVIKTLINSFRYPRRGPGMMWDAATSKIRGQGGEVLLGMNVTGAAWDALTGWWNVTATDAGGVAHAYKARHLISSAAIRDLVSGLSPRVPDRVIAAANKLRYRDFLVVALIVRDRNVFDDNWIYIHDPDVKVGRIQNFKSWSPEMVPDPALNCYGLEYFCFDGDQLWNSADPDLVELAKAELVKLNLARIEDIVDGAVVRQSKAYPVYDDSYLEHVGIVQGALSDAFPTLHLVGRNGMHKYNNQDHAMMTGLLTAENILAGRRIYDPWQVNQDAEYHEGGAKGQDAVTERMVPGRA